MTRTRVDSVEGDSARVGDTGTEPLYSSTTIYPSTSSSFDKNGIAH